MSEIEELRRMLEASELARKEAERKAADEAKRATALKAAMRGTVVTDAERARADEAYKRTVTEAYKKAPAMNPDITFAQLFSTDICFLIDTTGSMGPYFRQVKQEMKSIVAEVKAYFLNEAGVRLAVVSYKDFDAPAAEQMQVLDFTTDVDEVVNFIESLTDKYGGDAPEDVQGGMAAVQNLDWHHSVRCIIHIADAPAHGRRYNNLSDDYPSESPNYSPLHETMARIIRKDISYTLLRISPHTDIMFEEFRKMYEEANKRSADTQLRLVVSQLQLGTDFKIMRKSIVGTVTKVAATIGSSTVTKRTKELEMAAGHITREKALPLDESEAQWSNPAFFPLKVEAYAYSTNLGKLADMMYGTFETSRCTLDVMMHGSPFAAGAMRYAIYAKTPASSLRLVAKKFKSPGRGIEFLEDDMRAQALCKAFALEFSNLPVPYTFDFLCTVVLVKRSALAATATATGAPTEFYALEPYLGKVSDYVKYNSNFGYVLEDGEHKDLSDAAQAFSHFTFERSKGQILVADLQGLGQTLTDPVIHSRNRNLFKLLGGNLGVEGFKAFFMGHECNDTCRALRLRSNKSNFMNLGLDFFEDWASLPRRSEVVLCCSNKLCGKMVKQMVDPAAPASRASTPGPVSISRAGATSVDAAVWCSLCKRSLAESAAEMACTEAGCPDMFPYCPFEYEALLEDPPRKCGLHRKSPAMTSRIATAEISTSRRSEAAEAMGGKKLF